MKMLMLYLYVCVCERERESGEEMEKNLKYGKFEKCEIRNI